MPMIIHCACGQVMQAPDNAVGKAVRCPRCAAAIPVTVPPPEPPAAPANSAAGESRGAATQSATMQPAAPTPTAPKPAVSKPAMPKPAAPKAVAPKPAKRGKGLKLAIFGCLGAMAGCLSAVGFGAYWLVYGDGLATLLGEQKFAVQAVVKGPDIHARVAEVEPADTKVAGTKAADDPPAGNPTPPPGNGPRPGAPLKLPAHLGRVLAVRMNAKGVLVTAGDSDLKVWDPASWTVRKQKSPGRVPLLDVAANSSIAVFFTSSSGGGGKIWRWNWDSGDEPAVIMECKHVPDQLAVTPDGKAAVWDDNYALVIWDLEKNSQRTKSWSGYPAQIRSLAMNADATELVTVTTDVSEWWRMKPKDPPARYKIPDGTCAAFVNPKTLLVGTDAKKAIVWDLSLMKASKEMPLPGPARQAVRSADGKRIAIAADNAVVVYDITGEVRPLGTVTMPPEHYAGRIALDGPGHLLVTSGDEPHGRCLVWDIAQLK